MEKAKLLRRCELLSDVDEKGIKSLADNSAYMSYPRNDVFIKEGENTPFVYFIVKGIACGYKTSLNDKQISVDVLTMGELIGGDLIFYENSFPFSVKAVTELTALVVNKKSVKELIRNDNETCRRILDIMSKKLTNTQERLIEAVSEKIEQRLARLLLFLAGKVGPCIPCSKVELAGMTGTTSETVYRTTSYMKKTGMISTFRGRVLIKDLEKLRCFAENISAVEAVALSSFRKEKYA